MAELIASIIESRGGEEPALIDEAGTLNWGDFNLRVNRLIAALRSSGLGSGDRGGGALDQSSRVLRDLRGLCPLVDACSPRELHLVAEEVRYILENSGARALIVDPRFAELGWCGG